jgi:Cys-rich protein (TIGR01571 family)
MQAAPMSIMTVFPIPINTTPGQFKLNLCHWVTCQCQAGLMENCLMSWFCPCIRIGHVMGRTGVRNYVAWIIGFAIFTIMAEYNQGGFGDNRRGRRGYYYYDYDGYYEDDWSWTTIIIWRAIQLVGYIGMAVMSFMVRQHVVRRYQIQEDSMTTFLTSCCCISCSLCQTAAEVDLNEYQMNRLNACNADFRPPAGGGAAVANTYPQPQPGVVPPPPVPGGHQSNQAMHM